MNSESGQNSANLGRTGSESRLTVDTIYTRAKAGEMRAIVRPWIISCSDLRRYTYRAFAALRRNRKRVLFVYFRQDQKQSSSDAQEWLDLYDIRSGYNFVAIFSIKASAKDLLAAGRLMNSGKGRRVAMARMKPVKNKISWRRLSSIRSFQRLDQEENTRSIRPKPIHRKSQ